MRREIFSLVHQILKHLPPSFRIQEKPLLHRAGPTARRRQPDGQSSTLSPEDETGSVRNSLLNTTMSCPYFKSPDPSCLEIHHFDYQSAGIDARVSGNTSTNKLPYLRHFPRLPLLQPCKHRLVHHERQLYRYCATITTSKSRFRRLFILNIATP